MAEWLAIHLETWPPGQVPHNHRVVYLEIDLVYLEIYENLISHNSISQDIRVWAKIMTPKLGTVHAASDFFYHVWTCAQAPPCPWLYIVWWSQKWKNIVKKKNSGNSIQLHIYAHVQSISKYIPLILCINFVMPSIYFLLFINAHLESYTPVQDRAKLYVPVRTSTYRYIPVHNSTGFLKKYVLVRTGTYN